MGQMEDVLIFDLPEELVRKNLTYYSSYIDGELRKGRRPEDVFDELGDPALIARSIIDAAKSGEDGIPYTADDRDFRSEVVREAERTGRRGADCGTYDEDGNAACGPEETADGRTGRSGRTAGGRDDGFRPIHVHSAQFSCLTGLVLFAVIAFVIFTLLTALAPILMPILLVVLVIWVVKNIAGDR